MRLRTVALVALVAGVGFLASGCLYSREISHTRRSVERAFPGADFDRKMVFTVGSFPLRTSSWILGLAGDEDADNIAGYLADIDRVKIGIYDTEFLPEAVRTGTTALKDLLEYGWEPAVQVRDAENHVWILYRSHRNRIRDAFVIVLNDEQLVIVRVDGHLDRLIQRAVEDYRPFSRWATGTR